MRALKFALVGCANTGLDIGLFAVLNVHAHVGVIPANLISYSAGILLSFILNRAWTFRDRQRRSTADQLAWFAAGSIAGLALSTTTVAALAPSLGPLPAKAASIGVSFLWNYVYANSVVFTSRR